MTETIEALSRLQGADTRIATLERALGEIPARIQALEERLARAEEALEKEKARVSDAEKERRRLEREVAALEERRRTLLRQQGSVKTNKEYEALTREIAEAGDGISRAEDRLLELMEGEEDERRMIQEAEAARESVRSEVSEERAQLEAERVSLEGRLEEARVERGRLAAAVPPAPLALYERIRRSKGGLAVVRIANDSCGGCYRAVPPQKIAEAKQRKKIVHCEYCGRILTVV